MSMRKAAGAGFPSVLSYHSTQDIDGFWCRLVKDTFKGENAKETFNFKIYMILLQEKKKDRIYIFLC